MVYHSTKSEMRTIRWRIGTMSEYPSDQDYQLVLVQSLRNVGSTVNAREFVPSRHRCNAWFKARPDITFIKHEHNPPRLPRPREK